MITHEKEGEKQGYLDAKSNDYKPYRLAPLRPTPLPPPPTGINYWTPQRFNYVDEERDENDYIRGYQRGWQKYQDENKK